MRKLKAVTLATIALALPLTTTGCELFNGGITGSSHNIGKQILKKVNKLCGPTRQSEPHHGVLNIMLMDGREDDGIVTCYDGTNIYFDA